MMNYKDKSTTEKKTKNYIRRIHEQRLLREHTHRHTGTNVQVHHRSQKLKRAANDVAKRSEKKTKQRPNENHHKQQLNEMHDVRRTLSADCAEATRERKKEKPKTRHSSREGKKKVSEL